MKLSVFVLMILGYALSTCGNPVQTPKSTPDLSQATLALTNGTLIDGTGAEPLLNATLLLAGKRILAVGPSDQVSIPSGVEVIDLAGATMLPGLINAHVHDAYDAARLQTWARAGVTTVRDEGILSGQGQLNDLIALRNQLAGAPQYARLVSAGYMLSVPGGYGHLEVSSPDDARNQVNNELNSGADMIKLAMESGYAGVRNLANFTPEELTAIVETAHAHGRLVSAHITDVKFLPQLLEAGVDDLAHIPLGFMLKSQMQELIDRDIYVVTTLTVFEAYGSLHYASSALEKLVSAGVKVAMGNDYTFIPQNNFDHFELGMPVNELTRMNQAGMSSMEIIVASTRNAAHVCGLENELGTLEVGKQADILIVNGNPLEDLSTLTQVKMVLHAGEIIRR